MNADSLVVSMNTGRIKPLNYMIKKNLSEVQNLCM